LTASFNNPDLDSFTAARQVHPTLPWLDTSIDVPRAVYQ